MRVQLTAIQHLGVIGVEDVLKRCLSPGNAPPGRSEYSENRIFPFGQARYKSDMNRDSENKTSDNDERSPERKGDLQAQLDELGNDPAQVGENSAGQTASSLGLSETRDSNEESVEELSDADQALEAASV